MKSETKMKEIGVELLRELYANATPPLDWDKATAPGGEATIEAGKEDWYQDHYISDEDEEQIKAKLTKKHKLSKGELAQLDMLLLVYGPTNVKK